MSVLGLDVGTSGCKAVVVDEEGTILAKAHRDYKTIVPHPGHLEINPEDIWKSVRVIIREVVNQVGNKVSATCLATMGDSFVAVDKKADPVGNFILASDARSSYETELLVNEVGREEIFKITGMPPHPINTLTKILWLRRHDTETFLRSKKFLTAEDFIISKLGVNPSISYSNACRTMAFDINHYKWSSELLETAGITVNHLSDATPSGSIIGEIPPLVASQFGLRKGVKIVSGGMDQACGSLGSNAILNGQIEDSMGTVEALSLTMDDCGINQTMEKGLLEGHYSINIHVIPGKRLIMALILSAGAILNWFRDQFLKEEVQMAQTKGLSVFDYLLSQTAYGPTYLILLPYFTGSGTPCMNPMAKGVVFGLDLGTDKNDLLRAILQGIVHDVALNLDQFENLGIPIREIKCVGGGSRSDYWLQLKADIIGKPVVKMKDNDAAVLGAAILAGVGTGIWTSYEEAIQCIVKHDTVFTTRPKFNHFFKEQKKIYKELCRKVENIFFHYESLIKRTQMDIFHTMKQ